MSLPLIGSITAYILETAPVSIHGDEYLDAVIEPEPAAGAPTLAGATIKVRIARHAWGNGTAPAPGDRVQIDLLMGQITKVQVV